MDIPINSLMQQVHLGISPNGYVPVTAYQGDQSIYGAEHERLQVSLLRLCPPHLWYRGSNEASCPRPILVTSQHQNQLELLHRALTLAITDIVDRWWTDKEARLFERMPLHKQEEDLLRWLNDQCSHSTRSCRDFLGSWRPDFLVEEKPDLSGSSREIFRLTEINARFCFNGFMHQAYGQEALSDLGVGKNGIRHATDSSAILNGLLDLFQHDRPLHLLKGREPGIDIHMFIDFVSRNIGTRVRLITPADLRLVPDPQNMDTFKLCCVVNSNQSIAGDHTSPLVSSSGEHCEEIFQVGLELHQHELFHIPVEILRQVSLRCFNDMRTILLVHDKRMLGVIRQEIPNMVTRQVLSPGEGDTLKNGVAETTIPGSVELDKLIQLCDDHPERRRDYLLKPIRGGKGAGIVFGDEIGSLEWLGILKCLREPRLLSGSPAYVVQRRIWPRLYNVVLKPSGEQAHCLERHGILKISLGFPDPRSRYLEELIVSLHRQHRHGLPITHSAARGWFWDVRPNDTVFQAQSHQARSETMREFPWHTDSSYERSPPRYFALHVIQPDRYGGGTLSVMNVERLSQLLSPDIQTTLLAPEFGITVPLEFIKEPDQRYIVGNLLAVNAHDQSLLVRFREDIVTPLSARAAVAFDELKAALHHLETLSDSTLHLTATDLPERSIILLDNYRWLHARNRIRDPARHLRRVRWNATPFPT
ncbi:Clavaminate synthase-like protein [Aspergillus avenaceus]|uniref:Clavaminate synthase-like protein n=1 Tax=Aspergillus avenaceus TaxID=36643 RepID=A0A5N6U7S8_ASPAV|nr:Clavaminate synthase-like protein [Aspergillus avenaceus]